MPGYISEDDYIDEDTAYLLGLLVARGEIIQRGDERRLIVRFPKTVLKVVSGLSKQYVSETEIKLAIEDVRERLVELLNTDIKRVLTRGGLDLVAIFTRNSMAWRNVSLHLKGRADFSTFEVPEVLFSPNLPVSIKREFVRGYADVAGNIRPSNIDQTGKYRMRLDVLNYNTNWQVPVQLCLLLQEQLDVPVQLITWGHPNMGRAFKEHQLNIYAEAYQSVGFSSCFGYKNQILTELANANLTLYAQHNSTRNPTLQPVTTPLGCPGYRRPRGAKPFSPDENDAVHLAPELVGNHYDAYWQICKAMGCHRGQGVIQQALQLGVPLPETGDDVAEAEAVS